MELIQHTTTWIKGELFEAKLIVAFGLFSAVMGLLFWKAGHTPNAQALLWPLLVSGIIYLGVGGGMMVSNPKRMVELPQSYRQDKKAFAVSEKKRVDAFQYGYKVSKIVATLFFIVTLLIFWTTKNSTWMGIGIGLSYFAIAGLVVDYFSQERADTYYKAILAALH
ncbi:hypothetical protein [Siphonobacter sp. SORGH_AS_0500]|uniref:hypothetical protein n=1 Tax=Siphonobacter sp. SORGH_AS_0500 TaxID=1864824 RepID=UPI000CA67CAC|nr:hypothetical protein [Siphonobacter sp. SORGH_AS_0500]MDR6195815.1 hypothetical protein [Siphonobacter sp. SORGH_AS_0500]PKK37454.1 hypothetical protein BWI96_06185 [Siphonobacter sp. SORGH_AS_0500]